MAKPRVVNVQFNDESVDFGQYRNRLLAEGDSWFAWAHLNLQPSSNLLEQLQFDQPSVVVSCAYTGDVIRNMASVSSNPHFYNEMRAARYDAILLSGGGNDLIDALKPHGGKPGIISARAPGAPDQPASYVNQHALQELIDDVLQDFGAIAAARSGTPNSSTPIVLHTYDYPTPRNARATFFGRPAVGPWLYSALTGAFVPEAQFIGVTELIYDRMATALGTLDNPGNGIHAVATCGTIARAKLGETGLSGDWINEIHPDAHGYALLAGLISKRLHEIGLV